MPPDKLTGDETADEAFRRVAAGQVRLWRRIALTALLSALLYTIVTTTAGIVGAVWVVHFVARQDTAAATSDCRGRLSAEYDDQQSKFLDAADLHLADARLIARRNMRSIDAAREAVTRDRCPTPHVLSVPLPGE